jgi:inward rectifier potassium channel
MHPIDEESPLYGLDWENLEEQVVLLPVTLTGYDATYAQKTHARHTYLPSDIHPGERFVDVLSETEGGRMMIDFEKFHDTEPDDG